MHPTAPARAAAALALAIAAAADFRNTPRRLGATATAGGAPVTGFTVASASGTGWLVGATAVPEPSTVALLAAGRAALGVAARRRRTA